MIHSSNPSNHRNNIDVIDPQQQQQQQQQSSPTSVATMIIDTTTLPSLDAAIKSSVGHGRGCIASSLHQRIATSSHNDHTNEYDSWSNTSDMSVSTMQLSTTTPIPRSPPPITTKIPDATMQRKLDLQRHDALLKFTTSHHGNIAKSSKSTGRTNAPSKEPPPLMQQQQRHRFFGLRKKKCDF